VLRIWR